MTGKGSPGWSGDSVSEKLGGARLALPLAEPLACLHKALAEAPVEVLPAFIGELERLKAQVWSKLSRDPMNTSGQPIAVHGQFRNTPVDQTSEPEYLSIREVGNRTGYAEGTIRNMMSTGIFKLGEHYVKPRGRVLFKWSAIRRWLETAESRS